MDIRPEESRTSFLDGGGWMGALMRSHDWSRSPLGDPAGWPAALKIAVSTCLSSRFPMVVWWGPRLIMLYNDAWQPILGETKHPAGLGRPGAESWPETWPVVAAQFESALNGEASWSEDLLLASDRHGFLEESYFTYSHGPLRDATGAVVGVLSVVSETTARVLHERRLQTLARLSSATVEATHRLEPLPDLCQRLVDSLCRDNPDAPFAAQYLVDASTRGQRVAVTGLDPERLPRCVEPADQDGWGIAEALRTGTVVVLEFQAADRLPGGVWPEGSTQLLVLPLFHSGRDADLCGVLLVGINSRLRLDAPYTEFLGLVAAQFGSAISALQFVHREREMRADAQRAARLRDEFLATLSHELRSPLNAVLGWTQILKLTDPGPDLVATAIDVIERNARLQARLVTDLLDISGAVSGKLRLEVQDLDIQNVIGAAIESLAPIATEKDIAITTNLDGANHSIRGDPARIEQVLWNLLSNALKFSRRGGRVEIKTSVSDRFLCIRVSDDGEGIEPAFLPHLFDRFRQADASSARRHDGLGLGLAIVKQFTELHGGRVSVMSDGPGSGATFLLELPLGGGDRAPATPDVQGMPAVSRPGRIDLSGVRVLVVDDQRDALLMVERILVSAAATVTATSSAEEALDVLTRERFDVIVSDIAMPGMDGYEFAARLSRRGIATPAIALTAFAFSTDVHRAAAAGFRAHLPKPIDRAALLETVSRFARPIAS